jgi:hypothetical protein
MQKSLKVYSTLMVIMNKIIIGNLQVFIGTSETTYETFIINEDIVPTT